MVSRKSLAALGLATLTAVALAGCASDPEAPESDESFHVYVNLPLTGAMANPSNAYLAGMQVAADAINEDGGILGREIELTVVDDQLDTTRALTLLQEQLDSDVPDLVFLGATSNEALALLPVLTREKILSTGFLGSVAISDYAYAFSAYPSPNSEAEALVAKVAQEGAKKVALLTGNDANGQSQAEVFGSALEDAGVEIVLESYSPTDVDMTAQLQRLRDADPDLLFIEGFGAPVGHILTSRTKIGWDVTTIGGSGVGAGQDLSKVTTEADWVNFTMPVFNINLGETDNPDVLESYIAELESRDVTLVQSMLQYSLAWDILHIFQKGIEQANSFDPDEVAAALTDLQPNEDIDELLLAFPSEFMSWSDDDRLFAIDPDALFTYVTPGPIVNGIVTPTS